MPPRRRRWLYFRIVKDISPPAEKPFESSIDQGEFLLYNWICAKLRVEQDVVEWATVQAQERALQKEMSEKGVYKSKRRIPRIQFRVPQAQDMLLLSHSPAANPMEPQLNHDKGHRIQGYTRGVIQKILTAKEKGYYIIKE